MQEGAFVQITLHLDAYALLMCKNQPFQYRLTARGYFETMVKEDPKWTPMLKNKGLLRAADVLEKYGIGSATEVSKLEQDYFSDF